MASPPPSSPTPSRLSRRTLVGSDSWSSGCSTASTLYEWQQESAALVEAVREGDVSYVQSLMRLGLRINDSHYWILYHACLRGLDMVTALLSNPAINFNREIPGELGDKTLDFLVRTRSRKFRNGKKATLQLLFEHGVNPFLYDQDEVLKRDRIGDTILHWIAGDTRLLDEETEGCVIFQLLLRTAPASLREACLSHIDLKNRYNLTPLIVATVYDHVQFVELLLDNGANPDIKEECSYRDPDQPCENSALYYAVCQDNIEIVRLLLSHGAKVDQSIPEARSSAVKQLIAAHSDG